MEIYASWPVFDLRTMVFVGEVVRDAADTRVVISR